MHRRLLSTIALAILPGATLAAPADTAETTGQDAATSPLISQPRYPQDTGTVQQPGQPSAAQDQASRQDSTSLMATDELIGRNVVTQEGEHVGALRFVTVSLDRGSISHLIVDTSGAQSQSQSAAEGDLLIVPWSVAKVDARADNIVIAATARHISSAPRLQREELNRLTEPGLASYVIDYWAPASELAALEGRRQQDQTGAETPRQEPAAEKNPQQPHQPRMDKDVGHPDQARTMEKSRQQQRQAAGAPVSGTDSQSLKKDQATAQDPGRQQPGSTDGGQAVLVGQEVVAAVTPPMFQLSKALRGAQVVDRSGQQVGEVRQIMIDTRTGDAAFAIIEGTSAGRAPVPLQSLAWSAEGTTMLTADTSDLQPNRAMTENPGQVTRGELAELYQRFDTEPYWERSSRTSNDAASPAPQQGSSPEIPQ